MGASEMSLLFSSQTCIDFLYASYFIPLHQLGTLVCLTSLFGLIVFPFTIVSVILCKPASMSLLAFFLSMSSVYDFLIGIIFFLNLLNEFISSASTLSWAASANSVLLPAHDWSNCLPSLLWCNNVGILHISHSSSQSSLSDKSRNSFRNVSSPNDSTTILTILIIFLALSIIIRHFFKFFPNISLKISSLIALL